MQETAAARTAIPNLWRSPASHQATEEEHRPLPHGMLPAIRNLGNRLSLRSDPCCVSQGLSVLQDVTAAATRTFYEITSVAVY